MVDFPDPEGPTTPPIISPGFAMRERSRKIQSPSLSYRKETWSSAIVPLRWIGCTRSGLFSSGSSRINFAWFQ